MHLYHVKPKLQLVPFLPPAGILGSTGRVLRNKVFVLITINQVFFWFAFFGYITFKSKFLEHQFKMSATRANSYIGERSCL